MVSTDEIQHSAEQWSGKEKIQFTSTGNSIAKIFYSRFLCNSRGAFTTIYFLIEEPTFCSSVNLFFLHVAMTIWKHFRTKSTVKHSLKFFFKKVFVSHPVPAVDLRGALSSRDTLDHLLWVFLFGQPPLPCVFWRVRHVCVSVRSVLPRAGWEWWRLGDWQRPRADAGADTGGRDGDRPCRFAFARCWSVESTLRKSSRCSLTFLCWSFFSWRHSLWCIHETDPRSGTYETFESWRLEGFDLWPGSEAK